MHSENYLKWLDKHGVARPAHIPHLRDDELEKNLKPLRPHTWRQEGNLLIGEVEGGTRFTQTIPTNLLLTGMDSEGLPTFRKV